MQDTSKLILECLEIWISSVQDILKHLCVFSTNSYN